MEMTQEAKGVKIRCPRMVGTPRYEADVDAPPATGSAGASAPAPVAAAAAGAVPGGAAQAEPDGKHVVTIDVCFHPETVAKTLGGGAQAATIRELVRSLALEGADQRLEEGEFGGKAKGGAKRKGGAAQAEAPLAARGPDDVPLARLRRGR